MQSPSEPCRILVEPQPNSGSWNMAVDEALLESALERGECILRFYRWDEATVSLGYFQSADEADSLPGIVGLPIVRRLSGGGAILHHHELTYSCALPPGHPLAKTPGLLYERIHAGLIEVLGRHGVAAEMRGKPQPGRDGLFLCFGRGDGRDIVCDGHKIVGSAQRRRRGAVLQHGSILEARSPFAPDFPGIVDLCPSYRTGGELAGEFAGKIVEKLGLSGFLASLDDKVLDTATLLQKRKYERLVWHRTSRSLEGDRS